MANMARLVRMPCHRARMVKSVMDGLLGVGNSVVLGPSSARAAGSMGSGAGKGGGSGGSIRDAGGAFGQLEYVREEQYFRALQAEQIRRLKEHLDDEISYHEAQIKRHQEAISRHQKRKSRFPKVSD